MLIIRLQRTGKSNQADFRVVIAEKTAAASKKSHEILGSYNPRTKQLQIRDQERLQYWISQKVAMSPTVHNLFVTKEIVKADKVKAFSIPKKEAVAEEAKPAPAAEAPLDATEAPSEPAPTAEPTTETTEAAS